MIGDSSISVDGNCDVTLWGVTYEGTDGVWELLTKKSVDRFIVMPYNEVI